MSESQRAAFVSALADFRAARRRATLEGILAKLLGEPRDLLSYNEVRERLSARETARRTLKEIPLAAIVGSVGRYSDFTRTFLPRHDSDAGRWASVKAAMEGMTGLPPIEVYQIGDVYFVRDGNHRVSVLRQMGAARIEAYVTQVDSKVVVGPDVRPDDLIIKAEETRFLDETNLDDLRPEAELAVTVAGMYGLLLEHIAVHRYFMGIEQQREIPNHEAVIHWYDAVYMPAVEVIHERSILEDFPGRTETDLYLWVAEHREALKDLLGWDLSTEAAAADLAAQRRRPSPGVRVLQAVTPPELDGGPPPGAWRRSEVELRKDERLFADVLVALGGDETRWQGLTLALLVAKLEGGRIHGLHVIDSDGTSNNEEALDNLRRRFEERCSAAGLPGKLAIQPGEIAARVCQVSRLVDLLVLQLEHRPGPEASRRLSSAFRGIVRRCPRPVLAAVPEVATLSRALLAYDGSSKANEALYVATYLAARWGIELHALAVEERKVAASMVLEAAGEYLKAHGVEVQLHTAVGPVAETMLLTAEEHDANLILMGGYGATPLTEVVLGSVVDSVLSWTPVPVLMCR